MLKPFEQSNLGRAYSERPVLNVLLWSWIVVLVLVSALAVYATLSFDEYVRDVLPYKQGDIPRFRQRTSIATLVSLATLVIVLLRRFWILRWPPLWIVVLASIPAAGLSLAYDFSVAGLRT